jgi:hypothetical protein
MQKDISIAIYINGIFVFILLSYRSQKQSPTRNIFVAFDLQILQLAHSPLII